MLPSQHFLIKIIILLLKAWNLSWVTTTVVFLEMTDLLCLFLRKFLPEIQIRLTIVCHLSKNDTTWKKRLVQLATQLHK